MLSNRAYTEDKNRIARNGKDHVAADAKKQTWVMVVLCTVRFAHGWCQPDNEIEMSSTHFTPHFCKASLR
jgi:hypothetical protein